MPYPPRVYFEGAVYHVTARGDNREPIFFDDEDRRVYLALLARYKRHFQFTLYAYALMPNHVHLVLKPASGTVISRIMQCFTIAYARTFNRRHGRVGHVFQGRFHSRLITEDVYLLVVSRYIHLNPVRAKLVRAPGDFVWSSYRAYQDGRSGDDLTDTELVLGLVSPRSERQRQDYCTFVEMPWRSENQSPEAPTPYQIH